MPINFSLVSIIYFIESIILNATQFSPFPIVPLTKEKAHVERKISDAPGSLSGGCFKITSEKRIAII